MAQINYPNMNMQQGNQQTPLMQYPYGNNNYYVNPSYDNYVGRQQTQSIISNQYLKCRPVSSREEAMAFQIDLDGSLWVFPNVANNKIYTKQINNDGTATFNTYILTNEEDSTSSGQYVTKDEFNKVVQSIMAIVNPNTNNEQKSINF